MKQSFSLRKPPRWALAGTLAALAASGAWAQPLPVEPAEFVPLSQVAVPDVNKLGLLDKTGPGANHAGWKQITQTGQQTRLQALGKALFWDMQVGGDGIQACASCHFHAGADHRITNQINPGTKSGDFAADVAALNAKLGKVHFGGSAVVTAGNLPNAGLAVHEAAVQAAGGVPDDATGKPGYKPNGVLGKAPTNLDINDVVSSQGIRSGQYEGLGNLRANRATLDSSTPGFNLNFPNNAAGVPDTVRQVPPRNSPSVLNAVYNGRNFWDGRADMFFNGVNTLGARDPAAMVKVWPAGGLGLGAALPGERLDLPFSSLASQAVGPIGSTVEVIFDGRSHRALGKVLTRKGAVPLKGQRIAPTDSLLGTASGLSNGTRGLTVSYSQLIRSAFHPRFWGGVDPVDGQTKEVCLTATGTFIGFVDAVSGACTHADARFTLLQWNFPLFFGLAVQAYEATLTTGETIVDLLHGNRVTGTVSMGTGAARRTVDVTGKPMANCSIELANAVAVPAGSTPTLQQQADAELLCASHYAKWIPAKAYSGSQSANATLPVPANSPIGGCANPLSCAASPNQANAINTLINVERGLGRFAAGAWNCALCHGGAETTIATVAGTTGWGAPVLAPEIDPLTGLPEPVEQPVLVEKMLTFTGRLAAYDAGFYNIGVRPTPEDLGVGDAINGVPLSFAKILEVVNGTTATLPSGTADGVSVNRTRTRAVGALLNGGSLSIPTSPTDLTPRPYIVGNEIACDPEIAIDAPGTVCNPTVTAGEQTVRNGAFKTPGLRNVKFTGPYMHNGSKMNLRQVVDFYMVAGHFNVMNAENLAPQMRVINDDPADQANVIEMMETGLTDWRVAYQQAPFDHPELCLTHGHDANNGVSVMRAIPAVGSTGSALPIPTFEEMLEQGANPAAWTGKRSNLMDTACTVPGVADPATGLSRIDVPPSTTVPTGTTTQ